MMHLCVCLCEQLVSVEASALSASNELGARESEWHSASSIDGDAAVVVDVDTGVEGGRAII